VRRRVWRPTATGPPRWLGQFWDSSKMTLRDIACHHVITSPCCHWEPASHNVDSGTLPPFHTAGATGSIPVPPTILHQAARGASVNPIVSRLPTAVAAFWTVSSRT